MDASLSLQINKDNVIAAQKEGPASVRGAGGGAFPITAVQNWSTTSMRIRNGIFLGRHVFSLIFEGDFDIKGKILRFDFDRLAIKLLGLDLGFDLPARAPEKSKDRPFFLFLYADDDLCVAQGKGGGLAVWKRVDASWRLEEGVYVS